MPTLTISLAGSSVVNGSKTWTVTDEDVQTLIDFQRGKYSERGKTPLTNQQALVAWAQNFVRQTVGEIHTAQREAAQAALNVPPIVFTE